MKSIVLRYIQDKLCAADRTDIEIFRVEFCGSRVVGNAQATSDLDLIVEYKGSIREDDFFNLLNGELEIEGIPVDLNPICRHSIAQRIAVAPKSGRQPKSRSQAQIERRD